MSKLTVRKASGQLVELDRQTLKPELVVEGHDTPSIVTNLQALVVKMMTALLRKQHDSNWTPDLDDAKTVKELLGITLAIDNFQNKQAENDPYHNLSPDEIQERLLAFVKRLEK